MKNSVEICGLVKSVELSHTVKNTKFYSAIVESQRLVDNKPRICLSKLIFRDAFLDKIKVNERVHITGSLRSFKNKEQKHTITDVYARVENILTDVDTDVNIVDVEGTVAFKSELRTTKNKRNVCNFVITTPLFEDKITFIQMVAWGEDAVRVSKVESKSTLAVKGELRERPYRREIDGELIEYPVFEVSVSEIL